MTWRQNKKKQKKIKVTIEDVIDQDNTFSTFDDFLWEEDMFDNRDSIPTIDASKNILDKVNEISDNIFKNLRPVDNRTEQELPDDQNIPIEDRTQHELEDDDYLSLESDVEEIDTTSAWNKKNNYKQTRASIKTFNRL